MGGDYISQYDSYLVGSATTAATLTNAYAGNTVIFATGRKQQIEFYVIYTPAESGPTCLIQLENGPADDDFFKVTLRKYLDGSDLGEVDLHQSIIHLPKDVTTVADTAYKYSFSEPVANQYWRIGVKENGVSSDYGTVTIRIDISGR